MKGGSKGNQHEISLSDYKEFDQRLTFRTQPKLDYIGILLHQLKVNKIFNY